MTSNVAHWIFEMRILHYSMQNMIELTKGKCCVFDFSYVRRRYNKLSIIMPNVICVHF